jgi:uncharacterized protein (TIRG00374 family)
MIQVAGTLNVKRHLSLGLRLVVSAALLVFLLTRLDLRDMAHFLLRADLWLVALTLVTVLIDRCLMAGRWIFLLEALGIHAPRRNVVKIFFLSTFFGSFLPTGIGGEAVRAVSFSRLTSRGVESVTSVAMDRIFGMLSMLLTGLVALGLSYRIYPHPVLLITVLTLSAAAVAGLAVLLSRRLHQWLVLRYGESEEGWRSKVKRTAKALGRYRSRPDVLALVLAMSIGVQVLRVFQAYLLSEAMDLGTALVYFFCFVPPILIITMLPISVSGLGTTNLAYVALFSQVGMDPDGAFVLSVLILALGVIGNLPGGLIYAFEGFSSSESAKSDSDQNHENLERVFLQ